MVKRSFLAERISNVVPYAEGSSCVLPFELLFAFSEKIACCDIKEGHAINQ